MYIGLQTQLSGFKEIQHLLLKYRAIICNNVLDVAFHELKNMVSAETLLNYPECKIPFTVHTYAYDKYFGAVINQNDKYIVLFSIKLSKTQSDYTTREK